MINVGVLGATGAVGQRFVQLLAGHPWFSLTTLTASGRSAGRRYGDVVDWRLDAPFPDLVGDLVVAPTDPKSLGECDLVFSALPAEVAGEVETACAKAGLAVCTNASSHRMEADVPLVVPEVNPEHLGLIDLQRDRGSDGFIVTNPNCAILSFAPPLAALDRAFGVETGAEIRGLRSDDEPAQAEGVHRRQPVALRVGTRIPG